MAIGVVVSLLVACAGTRQVQQNQKASASDASSGLQVQRAVQNSRQDAAVSGSKAVRRIHRIVPVLSPGFKALGKTQRRLQHKLENQQSRQRSKKQQQEAGRSALLLNSEHKPQGLQDGGRPISLDLRRVPVQTLMDVLQVHTGRSFIVDQKIAQQKITIALNHLPWRNALRAIARVYHFSVDLQASMILVTELDQKAQALAKVKGPQQTRLFRLNHAQPQELQTALKPLFTDEKNKPAFSIDPHTRALLVKGNVQDTGLIQKLTKELDQSARQIEIEAFIVEVNHDFTRSLGTRLGVRPAEGTQNTVAGSVDAQDNVVQLSVQQPNFGITGLFDRRRLRFELTALEREGKSKIISNPKIFTLENRAAIIFQGQEIPYQTVSENGTQTSFKEAGVRLAVTPSIVGETHLLLEIQVNKDSVDTRLSNPPITRRQISTTLKVSDQTIVVIGGIYFDTETTAVGRVPLLGSLPILGRLFERRSKTQEGRELLVFIAPRILS